MKASIPMAQYIRVAASGSSWLAMCLNGAPSPRHRQIADYSRLLTSVASGAGTVLINLGWVSVGYFL